LPDRGTGKERLHPVEVAPGAARIARSVTGVVDQLDLPGSHHLPSLPPWRTVVTTAVTPALPDAVPRTVRSPPGFATAERKAGEVMAVTGLLLPEPAEKS